VARIINPPSDSNVVRLHGDEADKAG
jgi:hypothetical protein